MKNRVRFPVFFLFSFLVLGMATEAGAGDCDKLDEPTFKVHLERAPEYAADESILPDSLLIPNGRPIYAIFVHGFTQNETFDQLMCYNFAKRLMEDGAYVHYAWWNNLCAQYMARPLHQANSHPGDRGFIGYIGAGLLDFADKAIPEDDYQFQADAESLLVAIRRNNPSAMIVLAGHSMGGASVARLATNTKVVIDILAPLDPVENRSWPVVRTGDLYNWTRYRIGHQDIQDPPPYILLQRTFGTNVINLHHRFQNEGLPPSDYTRIALFGHSVPQGGTSTQRSAATCASSTVNCFVTPKPECCNGDGHGELIGFRGLEVNSNGIESVPVGLLARGGWPTAVVDSCQRRRLLIEMPYADYNDNWIHRPENPELCLVSEGLISLYESMNRPPKADAGGDRSVERTLSGVTLDGTASTDPNDDDLTYSWQGAGWVMQGPVVTPVLGTGTHKITLTVKDPSGHLDLDTIKVTVAEGEAPSVTRMVGSYPNPFNLATRIVFELTESRRVSLEIFDLQGRLVQTLEDGTLGPGRYERTWQGLDNAGRAQSSGPYLVRMGAGDLIEFSKISLVK